MGLFDRSLEWEWVLSSGAHVKASLDVRKGVESVWFEKRLVSRAAVGAKVDGHVVPLPAGGPYRGEEARVTFDAAARSCTFRFGDSEVPATRFPGSAAKTRSTAQWAYLAIGLTVLLGVSGVAAAIARAGAARGVAAEIDVDAPLTLSFASPDGLLVAHFPTGFTAGVEASDDEGLKIVKVTRPSIDAVVGFISVREPGLRVDELESSIGPVVGEEWTMAGGGEPTLRETSRSSGACFGERGVIVERRLTKGLDEAHSWSCTFLHNGRGYSFFYLLPNGASAGREAILRRIVEGTELTGEAAPAPASTVAARSREDRTEMGSAGVAGGTFRTPTATATMRTTISPPPVHRPTPVITTPRPRLPDPPRSGQNIVCDGTGACFGSNGPPPSKGVVRGR